MYNISYSMKDAGWEAVEFQTNATTMVQAFMCAVREIRTVLMSKEVTFLIISDTEFVIWLQGKCKGFLVVNKVGPVT